MKNLDENTNQPTYSGLLIGVIAIGVEALIISPILEDISQTFHVTPGVAGWSVSAYGLALAIFSPLFASISERFQREKC
jgi:predicted MFS family arabinose efflux permease